MLFFLAICDVQRNKCGDVEVESKKSMEENNLLFSCAQDRFKSSQTDIKGSEKN
jgi:hypothetical protein